MGARFWRYVAVAGLTGLFAFALYSTLTQRSLAPGIAAGRRLPPFAAPLALGGGSGYVNVATHPNQGQAGRRPACSVRGAGVFNVCDLYRENPVVLALFIDGGSCPEVLSELQSIAPSFPSVRFAAVAVRAQSEPVGRLVRKLGIGFPVGVDRDGVLGVLYRMESCAQVTFARRGGIVQGGPLHEHPPLRLLEDRVRALVGSSRAQGQA